MKSIQRPDYEFAIRAREKADSKLKWISIGFGVLLMIFTFFALFNSFVWFPFSTTRLSRPLYDPQVQRQKDIEEYNTLIENYSSVRIPYRDPDGRFAIEFATPYVSGDIVVYIKTNKNQDDIRNEVNAIIENARKTVEITSVKYINDY